MNGVDLATIPDLPGHSDIKMTLRYAHLEKGDTSAAVEIHDQKLNKMDGKGLEPSASTLRTWRSPS